MVVEGENVGEDENETYHFEPFARKAAWANVAKFQNII